MSFGQNVSFILGKNNFGTPQPGQDYISGMIFTSATVPSGFTNSVGIELFSVSQAESLGIVGDYSDETVAKATIQVVATASAGNTITLTVTEPDIANNGGTNIVTVGTYTLQTTDVTNNTLAANLAAFVNTSGSGYTAVITGATNSFSLVARTGIGPLLNSVSPTFVQSATASGLSFSSFSGGVASVRILEHYQIAEFFRLNINGILWVMYTGVATQPNFTLINTLQNQAGNSIRQLGIFNPLATSTGVISTDLDSIQSIANILINNYAPLSVLYAPNLYGFGSLSTLANLGAKNDNFVSCVIGQDGGALGAYLSIYASTSVPCYGAALGLLSSAKVSDNIGWVGKYPITTGAELAVPAFSNKQLFSTLYGTSLSLLTQLDVYRYIFLMTRPNISGVWVNDTHTACNVSNDYAYIERNRTIDKVLRASYAELVPLVNSPELLNANGTLTPATIAVFTDAEKPSLDAMVQNQEISAYQIIIDPTQNVQSTSTIDITIRIVGVGVARNIVVTLGYTLSI